MDKVLIEEILSSNGPLSGEQIKEVLPVNGGCIHQAWQITLKTGQKLFSKTANLEDFAMLDCEAKGLSILNKYINPDFLIIPKPIIIKRFSTSGVLLMPWFDMNIGNEQNLGKGLALMHKESSLKSRKMFGWDKDGFIGTKKQIGGWRRNWGDCFVNLRLIPQLQMAKAWGLDFNNTHFESQLISYLNLHEPLPSLVHGDLWKGNTGIHQNGEGIIFDPAIWWADREVDIAMTKLFGGFSSKFYEAYEQIWKLPSSYEERINIYNLYHLLNHANIFGGSYKAQSLAQLKKLASFLNSI